MRPLSVVDWGLFVSVLLLLEFPSRVSQPPLLGDTDIPWPVPIALDPSVHCGVGYPRSTVRRVEVVERHPDILAARY